VLIGDEPGKAISASAISYGESDVETALDTVNGRLSQQESNSITFGGELFSEQALSPIEEWTQTGMKLSDNGYRVADEGYKLERYRVFDGDIVKVESDHKWQFQTSYTVPATGTQYKVGNTNVAGEMYVIVPSTAAYVIISTPIESNAHVYKCASNIDELLTDVGVLEVYASDDKDSIATLSDSIYTTVNELPSVQTSEGWKLTDDGYRIADADYQLMRFRVYGYTHVKVVSDHNWQFQTSTTVPGSGTQYKVGPTRRAGTYCLEIPDTVTYVVISTKITDSGAHVYNVTDTIDIVKNDIEAVKATNKSDFSAILNAYTSQVSDITYPNTVTPVTIGIDTETPKFISGSGHALVIPIISGTSIRVAKPQTVYCTAAFTVDYPAPDVAITHLTKMNSVGNTEFVAESQATDNYLVIYTHSTEIAVADCTFAYSQTARGTVELIPQLDTHMINLLKYRPVGKISKPYIAISCDDGLEPLATYTLPRIQYWNNYYNTNIPLHMALFDNSPVLLNAEYTALVKDMCDNHKCSIGIHGTQPYTVYSSPTALYAYLKKQEATIIERTGVTPTSVVYPHDAYTDQIMVMSGSFCGICASSSSTPKLYKYVDESDRYYYVGEKTNLYDVPRFNISDTRIGNANALKGVIDYAYEHNYVVCPYFHDIDFTEHTEAANQFARTMFDTLIQYGMEKGIEFINFGDIRFLT
jgi:hypothetical protein